MPNRIEFLFVLLVWGIAGALTCNLLVIKFHAWPALGALTLMTFIIAGCFHFGIRQHLSIFVVVLLGVVGWMFGYALVPQVSMGPDHRLEFIASHFMAGYEYLLICEAASLIFVLTGSLLITLKKAELD